MYPIKNYNFSFYFFVTGLSRRILLKKITFIKKIINSLRLSTSSKPSHFVLNVNRPFEKHRFFSVLKSPFKFKKAWNHYKLQNFTRIVVLSITSLNNRVFKAFYKLTANYVLSSVRHICRYSVKIETFHIRVKKGDFIRLKKRWRCFRGAWPAFKKLK